jgi:hypothetical protein
MNAIIKLKLEKIGFKKDFVPKGLRRKNQFKKYFNEKEWKYLNEISDNIFESFYLIFNNFEKGKCEICGNDTEYINFSNGYKICCSKKCLKIYKKHFFNEFAKSNNVDNISQLESVKKKKKETYLKKYNVSWLSKSNEIKEKIKQTNLKKYGCEYVLQNEFVKEKSKNKNKEKYGVENPMQNKEIKNKVRKTNRVKYFEKFKEKLKKYDLELDEISYFNEKIFLTKCKKCNRYFENNHMIKMCPYCYNYSFSKQHKLIMRFLDSLNVYYETNKRIKQNDKQYEIDIFIPELNIGIEINGYYWHSLNFKDENYHKNKQDFFRKLNINIIFLWEFDISNSIKFEIIKSMIKYKLHLIDNKIYGRKTEIKYVENDIAENFLNENHLQGYKLSNKNIGLYYKNELVFLMTFSKINENEFEIVRVCNKINNIVIGGFSKLLNYFINNYQPISLSVFVDKDFVDKEDNVYLKFGFLFEDEKMTYFFVKNGKRYNNLIFQKENFKIDKIFVKYYMKEKTKFEILKEKNYYICVNSGQLKYKFLIKGDKK